ncbi:MAG: hypothetical protein RL112_924 [Planctomycetota bacterium]
MHGLWSLLERAERLHPSKRAFVEGARVEDYATFAARARRLASFLRLEGAAEGERVSGLLWNGIDHAAAYYAASGAGAIFNPLNTRLAAAELAAIAKDCDARLVVSESGFAEVVRAALGLGAPWRGVVWTDRSVDLGVRSWTLAEALEAGGRAAFRASARGGDDVAHLYYTSGTTGAPKGVMLTHANVLAHSLGAIGELGIVERDRWAHIAAMFHLADAWATFAFTWTGATHLFLPRFEAQAALDLMERERATITNLIPTMLNAMARHEGARGRDWSALRAVLSGGAPIAPALVAEVVDVFGCEYVNTYGMTETSPYLTLSLLKDHHRLLPREAQLAIRAKTGRPYATVELEVRREDGTPVARDEREVGEIRVRGATVMKGYWNKPEETARAFVDGWLATGDLAVVDAEGYVTIVDRAKDMILSGGENVYSTEVEHALASHPAVLECAAYGVPDERLGECVRAAVVLRPARAATQEELVEWVKARLARYKAPKAIDFLEALPRTGSGKIQKSALREPHWSGRARRVN